MPAKVDLYNSSYGNYGLDVYREIRVETYGEDFGQTSWVTTEESHEIPQLLDLSRQSSVLEIGCGSGRYALWIAETVGCRVFGLDINSYGIENANGLAATACSLVRFEECDVSRGLPFADGTLDAAFANDVLCHIPNRSGVLAEVFRVLRPGGRLLFSDALIIGGLISDEEIATRCSIGSYVFAPQGENERLLKAAGFHVISVRDTSAAAAAIAKRRHAARGRRKTELIAAEGQANFEGLQRFLEGVHRLSSEKRLLRCLYVARKEA